VTGKEEQRGNKKVLGNNKPVTNAKEGRKEAGSGEGAAAGEKITP